MGRRSSPRWGSIRWIRPAGPAPEVPFQLANNLPVWNRADRRVRSGANKLFASPKVLGQEFGALPGPTLKAAFHNEVETVEVPLLRPFALGDLESPLCDVIGDPSIDMRTTRSARARSGWRCAPATFGFGAAAVF